MSRMRTTETDEDKLVRRIMKKMTGHASLGGNCTICGKELSRREIISENLVWCQGKSGNIIMHKRCYAREYLHGTVVPQRRDRAKEGA